MLVARYPECAGVEHQVAIRLNIDDQPAAVLVREGHAEGDADLRGCAEGVTGVPVGLVEIPELARPVREGIGGEHPILILDDVPDLACQAGSRRRRCVPVLPCFLLPVPAGVRVDPADLLAARLYA